MDTSVWEAYKNQERALRRKYRRKCWLAALIWLVYYSVSTVAVVLFVYPRWEAIGLLALIMNTFLSLPMMLMTVKDYRVKARAQQNALTEQAPMGKIRLHDE